jgi:hypothetical protein
VYPFDFSGTLLEFYYTFPVAEPGQVETLSLENGAFIDAGY